ncbi:hypothetical protein OBBRIDRAFT_133735 [Obba rivulosa]|uniref:Uncharacterized protein n=1 Tax=Obba rivulosa TaxID=1052685 RepID=A0A8E2DJD4_9APHY|nr:hypothetical protein OBBRIDRAFT_133735 [Obba rivulosa]
MLVRTADDNPPLKGPSPKAKGHIKKIIAAFSSGIKNKTSKTRSRSRSMPRLASAPSKPSGLLSLSQSTSSYDVIRMSPSMVSEQMHTPSTFATSEPFTSEEPTAMNGLRIIEATPDRADAQSHKSNLLPRLLDSVHESSLYAKLLEVYEMYNTDGSANHSITSYVPSTVRRYNPC